MGSPYLNTNESIILSTHNVIINTVPAEAILTNQRLILVDARHTELRPQDISFTALETITIGDNSAMEPILSLSVVLPDQTRHMLGVVFPQAPKTKRMGERDAWATKLKELSIAGQQENGIKPAELLPPWVPGELPEEEDTKGKNAGSASEKFSNPPLVPRKPRARTPKGTNRKAVVAGILVVLVIAAAIGVFFFSPSLMGGLTITPAVTVTPQATATPVETPVITQEPTAESTPAPAATPEVTVPETTTAQSIIPQSGVWVGIEYSSNYTASFGTAGRLRELTASSAQFYQIPAKNEIVIATVRKNDESGNVLTVSIYNNGELAKSGTTTSPHGTVEIQADLRMPATVTETKSAQTG